MSALPPNADMCSALAYVRFGPIADIARHMKPGLRGRYCAQFPKSCDDIRTIGSVMRIPTSMAALRAASHGPERNAVTCDVPLSAAIAKVVLNAVPISSLWATAIGPI